MREAGRPEFEHCVIRGRSQSGKRPRHCSSLTATAPAASRRISVQSCPWWFTGKWVRLSGERRYDAEPITPDGCAVWVACGCGARLDQWVSPADAEADLLRSTLLAFQNWPIGVTGPLPP